MSIIIFTYNISIHYCPECKEDKTFSIRRGICNSCKYKQNKERIQKQKSINFNESHRECDICKEIKESFKFVTNAIVCNQCRLNKSRANKTTKDKSRSPEMEELINKSKKF